MIIRPWLSFVALYAGMLGACGPKDLRVEGLLERTVGEKVILELRPGSVKFGDAIELVDARGKVFDKTALKSVKEGDLKVSFQIPTGIGVGAATVSVGQATGSEKMKIPLTISRIALTFDDQGKLESLPLPGSSLGKTEIAIGSSGGTISLSPSSNRLAVLSGGELRLLAVGKTIKDAAAGVQAPGGTVVAATDDGAIVGADQSVSVFNLSKSASEDKLSLPRVKAIAVAQSGKRAAALSYCDTNKDNIPDADCVTAIELGGAKATLQPPIVVDTTPSATQIAITADGKRVVIADTNTLYGVDLDTKKITTLAWQSSATPVGIVRAPSTLGELFAVADSTNNIVRTLGFDKETLAPVKTITLKERPAALAYGRLTMLYVATGTGLLRMDVGQPEAKIEKLPTTTTNPISSLAVQR